MLIYAIFKSVLAALLAAPGPADAADDPTTIWQSDRLGERVCRGDSSADNPCRLSLYPRNDEVARVPIKGLVPMRASLLGEQVCVGGVPGAVDCDLRIGVRAKPEMITLED